ncbi:DotA/TraY family protein [Azospirillum canadense]|uniref:DotA/TraY family protein n=1 Tax=Azospirillum canadense TaxID=403962 RepID=UPI0022271C65|nr:DotA/TraY family protein [Azospirillum canadense]MCW2240728.1 conjugal transfer/type IV secretion protein DotA/TraY [Azospirillum canadense]
MRLPDGRSAFGFVLAPVEMTDFRNLGAQWQEVARGVALGMVQAGLLSDDDPAVRDGRGGVKGVLVRATDRWREKWAPRFVAGWRAAAPEEGIVGQVGGVVEVTWAGRHEFLRETAAVGIGWSLLLAVWFGMAWAFLVFGVTPAYAAVTNADLARQALGDLLPFLGSGGTLLSQGLGSIVGALSAMACLVAALAALLSLVVMVVDTATSSDFARGKYQWTMFALRVGVAMMLLWPINGSWGLGSQLVGFVAAYGSDKASEAWDGMTSYLANKDKWVSKPGVGDMEVMTTVVGVVTAEACKAAINLDPKRNDMERVVAVPANGTVIRWDYQLNHWYGWTTESSAGCGAVKFPEVSASAVGSGAATAVSSAHKEAFETMRATAEAEVTTLIKARLACRDVPANCKEDPKSSTIAGLPASYKANVQSLISDRWQTINSDITAKLSKGVSGKGWIGAGEWAQAMTNLQGSLGAAGNAVPQVSGPLLDSVADGVTAVHNWFGDGLIASGNPIVLAQMAASSGNSNAGDSFLEAWGTGIWQTVAEVPQMNALAGLSSVGHKVYLFGGATLILTKMVGGSGGGVQGSDILPWYERASNAVVDGVVKVGLKLMPGPAKWIGKIAGFAGETIRGLEPILVGAGMALFVTGLGLAYLVPALPFIRFLFAVVSWLIAVLETVIMVIIALVLVVTPESGGFLGPHARSAFMNLVALFVRPLLTLAGFVAGLALTSVSVGLLNALMLPMMRDATGGGVMFISFVVYMFVYLGIAYALVNMCTKTPDTLAVAAYRWAGANGGGGGDEGGGVGGSVSNVAQNVLREIAMRARPKK